MPDVGSALDASDASAPACPAAGPATADLYVAPNGSDSAAGTMSAPTTLAAVDAKVTALQANRTTPIVVFLEDGTYDLQQTWTPSVSGTAQAPIVYTAAPGATPIISGGVAIKSWTETTINGVAAWQASAAGLVPFEQLWVNGTRHYRPTTTPSGYLYNANALNQATYTSFPYAGTDVAPSYYDLPHVEVDDFESWTMPRMRIASISPSTHVVTLTGSTNVNSGQLSHGFIGQHRYLLENVKEALGLPGQWYLDQLATTPTVYYVPTSSTEDPNSESIIAPQLTTALMTAKNLSYVTFQGITFSVCELDGARGGLEGLPDGVGFERRSACRREHSGRELRHRSIMRLRARLPDRHRAARQRQPDPR